MQSDNDIKTPVNRVLLTTPCLATEWQNEIPSVLKNQEFQYIQFVKSLRFYHKKDDNIEKEIIYSDGPIYE